MYSVDLMMEEHRNINRMLAVMQRVCCNILDGGEVEPETFRNFISFTREYADKHHHGKEEKFMFPEMVAHLGPAAENLVTHGMLVEHDLGRSHIMGAETALKLYEEEPKTEFKLDLISETMGYAYLLQRHTEKENNVVYPFGERSLSDEIKTKIDNASKSYEEKEESRAVRDKYLKVLTDMEAKYLR